MSRVHITAERAEQIAGRLTPREHEVVQTLDRLRVASSFQLQRLHVWEGTPASNVRQARRLLAHLTELRVVARLERRVGGATSGSDGYVYGLDVAGQRIASACGPAGGLRLRRPWTPGVPFLRHAVAVSELYVWLIEQQRGGALEVLDFDAEPLCWRRFTGPHGAAVMLKPDAYARLRVGQYEDSYFVEVDRATVSGPALTRKLTTYRRFWQTGREQERRGVFPRVLWLVPSEARKAVLVDRCASQPADAWPLFQIARYADAPQLFRGEGS